MTQQDRQTSAGAVLVGRGRLRNVWAVLAYVPAITIVAIVLGYGFMIWIADANWNLKVVFWLCLVSLAVSWVQLANEIRGAWAPVAKIAYYVDGTRVLVRKGDELLASVDVAEVREIRVTGQLTFITSLTSRSGRSSMHTLIGLLPRVAFGRVVDSDVNSGEDLRELPPILLVGRHQTEAFRDRLFAELRAAGVRETQLHK